MKESNYNKMGKTGKKNFILFAIFLLFITLLRSPVPYGAGLFDSNPPRLLAQSSVGADNCIITTPPLIDRQHFVAAGRISLNQNGDWLDELIGMIWVVESKCQYNPPDGDGGRAVGPLQIHTAVVDDVNFFCNQNFSYEDRRDPEKAKQIARLYIAYWLDYHKKEIACRIFNGGPFGWRKTSTDVYWEKIQGAK